MRRLIPLLAALSFSSVALPQATTVNPAIQQVQLLAPQLLAFAGSAANFQSLVDGLTQGTPVTLTTVNADGTVQIVTFSPGTTLTPVDAARALETARQRLISQGIAAPTAQQVAVSLMGGALPTALGTTSVTGVLSGNAGATPVQVRTEAAAPAAGAAGGTAGLATNTPVTLPGANGNVTFNAAGRAMSPLEINQALQLANILLAQQGILNPTAEQLQAALFGGNVATTAGAVPLQGILQGQVRNTSDSPSFGTSDSRVLGTSNTPVTAPTQTPRALVVPGAGAATAGGTTAAPRIGASSRR
jgi:hypothetical protein